MSRRGTSKTRAAATRCPLPAGVRFPETTRGKQKGPRSGIRVLSGRRRRRGGGMDRLFEQTGGIGLDLTALRSDLLACG
jgi:hypothetical protein